MRAFARTGGLPCPGGLGVRLVLLMAVVGVLLASSVGLGVHPASPPSAGPTQGTPSPMVRLSAPASVSPSLAAAQTPAPSPAPEASGSVGEVGYTWDLANDTTYARAVSPSLHWDPSAMVVDNATGTLWVAWGPNPLGVRDNVTLVNLSSGEVVGEVPATTNATNLLYVPALDAMFVTQTTRSNGQGRVLFLNATTGAPEGTPVALGVDPAGMTFDPYAGLLYVLSNGTGIATSISVPSFQVVNPYLPVGIGPDAAAYDPQSGAIYVANYVSGNITVLNGSTGAPVGPGIVFPSASLPIEMTLDPATGYLYVTFISTVDGRAAIGIIDPSIEAAIGESETGNPGIIPASSVLDPSSGLFLLPLRSGSASLGLLTYNPITDAWNNSGSFPPGPVGAYPSIQAIDVASQVDYVGHAFDATSAGPSYLTTVLLHNFSQGPIVLLGASARGGTYDPANGRVYVADSFTTALYGSEPDTVASFNASGGPIDSTTPIGYDGLGLSAGDAPESVAYDPVLNDLVVANGGTTSDMAALLNATTGAFIRTLSLSFLGPYPPFPNDSAGGASEVLFDPVHDRLYFASPADGILGLYAGNLSQSYLIYPDTPQEPGQVDDLPYQTLALDPATGLLYSVAPGYPGLVVDNPLETGFNASIGWVLGHGGATFGSGIAFDPVDSSVYVSDPVANVVYVVNATNQSNALTAETIPVGIDPVAVAFDPQTDSILVANYGSSNLTVINGTTQRAGLTGATSIPVAAGPSGLIVDAAQNTVLVTSALLGTVQAVSPAPAIYSYTISRTTTDVGVPVSLNALAIGGVGTLQYVYSGLPPGCSSSDVPVLSCTPAVAGSYTIGLTVGDAGPFTTVGSVELTVHPDPSVSLTATTPGVDVGLPLGTTALVANGTAPWTVSWNFGDGATATGTSAEHIYAVPGSFTVEARVVDALGVVGTSNLTVRVGNTLGSRIAGPTSGSAQAPVSLNGTAIAGVAPYSFVWTFGDGASVQTGVIGSNVPNSSEVSHTYAAEGSYHVTVLVSDGGGERSLSSWNVTIGPAAPPHAPPGNTSTASTSSSSLLPPTILGADLVALVVLILVAVAARTRRPAHARVPSGGPPPAPPPGSGAPAATPDPSEGPAKAP